MSIAATTWAARQQTSRPADKLVLWAMADQPMPAGMFRCFCAVATVTEFTGLDRKTVLAAQTRLKAAGLIIDTGERRGATKQVIVWRLPVESVPETALSGTVPEAEQSQKRNSPVSSSEQSRKGDTEPETEPEKPSKASPPKVMRLNANDYPMPDGVDPQHWQDFLANRKRKQLPNTRTAHAKLLRDLERFADDEWPPPRILQHAAERGWAGIYDPRNDGQRNGQRSQHHRQPGTQHPGGRTGAAADRVFG